MGPLMVVAVAPVLGHAAHLVQAGEDVAVQHLGAEGAIEALNVGILGRLAGLDVQQLDAVLLSPLPQRGTDELRPVSRRRRRGAPRSSISSSSARTTCA
jgi:hypothetical protein